MGGGVTGSSVGSVNQYISPYNNTVKAVLRDHLFMELSSIEPRCEKTGLRGFRPGLTQTRLYNHRRWLKA